LKSPDRPKEETSNQVTFGLSGHCPYGDLSRNRFEKNGEKSTPFKDEAQCLRFLPSVEMTIVLEKKKGSECGRRSRPHSLHNHHLMGQSFRPKGGISNQAIFGFEKSQPAEEETSNQAIFGLSGHCPYGDLSRNRLEKSGEKSTPFKG